MELRNINTFLHIAELHSFSRTARQLGYSQSAVSSQIAQLEAELGAPLFDRVGKTVRLTGAGETFLGYARTLLATVQRAAAHRAGRLGVQHLSARPAPAVPRAVPAGGTGALHRH